MVGLLSLVFALQYGNWQRVWSRPIPVDMQSLTYQLGNSEKDVSVNLSGVLSDDCKTWFPAKRQLSFEDGRLRELRPFLDVLGGKRVLSQSPLTEAVKKTDIVTLLGGADTNRVWAFFFALDVKAPHVLHTWLGEMPLDTGKVGQVFWANGRELPGLSIAVEFRVVN